jgi:hypothetical protein
MRSVILGMLAFAASVTQASSSFSSIATLNAIGEEKVTHQAYLGKVRLYSEDDKKYLLDYLDCGFEIHESKLSRDENRLIQEYKPEMSKVSSSYTTSQQEQMKNTETVFVGVARALGRKNIFGKQEKNPFLCNDDHLNLIVIMRTKDGIGIERLLVKFVQMKKPFATRKFGVVALVVMQKDWFTPKEEEKWKGTLTDLGLALLKAAATRGIGK